MGAPEEGAGEEEEEEEEPEKEGQSTQEARSSTDGRVAARGEQSLGKPARRAGAEATARLRASLDKVVGRDRQTPPAAGATARGKTEEIREELIGFLKEVCSVGSYDPGRRLLGRASPRWPWGGEEVLPEFVPSSPAFLVPIRIKRAGGALLQRRPATPGAEAAGCALFRRDPGPAPPLAREREVFGLSLNCRPRVANMIFSMWG